MQNDRDTRPGAGKSFGEKCIQIPAADDRLDRQYPLVEAAPLIKITKNSP